MRSAPLLSVLCLLLCMASPCVLRAQVKPVYQVGILADIQTGESSAILERLTSEIQAVVGEDAIVEFPVELRRYNNFDPEAARVQYEDLAAQGAHLILAFGYVNSRILKARETFPVPTILFGTTNQEIAAFDLSKETSGIADFTYLIAVQSYEEDLRTFRELTDYKHVGIAMEAGLLKNLPLAGAMEGILGPSGATYRLIPFESTDDILANLEGLDALYMAGGYFLPDAAVARLADGLLAAGIPSFTNTSVADVQLGLLATNRSENSLEQFIRRMALTIEAWVNGASLSELPVSVDFGKELTINYNTAQRIGLPVKYSLIASTRLLGSPEKTTTDRQYSLLDVILGGLDQNLGLLSQSKDVELSQQEYRQAKSNYLPSLTANASLNKVQEEAGLAPFRPEYSTDGSLVLQQTLFSPDANLSIGVQRNLQLAEQSNLDAAQLDAVLQGSSLYFSALLNKVNVQIQNQNLQLTRENLKIAEQNYQAGQAGKTDVLRFRSQMAQNTQTLVESINALEQSYLDLKQFLNNPMELDIEVMDAVLGEGVFESYNYQQIADILDNPQYRKPFVGFLIEEARRNAPELEALAYAFSAVEKDYNRNALGRLLPTVALQASYNQNFNQWGQGSIDPDPDGFYSLGLNVRLPLFNQFRTELNRQSARIRLDQIELDRENLNLSISRNVNQGVLNLINQMANIKLSEVSASAAEEALELVRTAYGEGAVNIIQLIDAQNNFLQAQLAQAGATYNFLITAIQLERFIGYNFLLHTDAENLEFRNRFETYMVNHTQE